MIINNTVLLIIGSIMCVLGSIPTLCLCCYKCETTTEIISTEENYKYIEL